MSKMAGMNDDFAALQDFAIDNIRIGKRSEWQDP